MLYVILAIHILVCIFIIIVVLLQSGKSADVAAAFGGMGSQTAFGPRSAANVLTKATTWSAVIFMLTSITLSVMMGRRTGGGSVLEGVKPAKQTSAPAQPGAPAKGSNQEPQPVTR
jgi:preprotein translocase subunit SecG